MVKIAYIGAGSLQFGPLMVQDILLSEILAKNELEIHLMDITLPPLEHTVAHAEYVCKKLNHSAKIVGTTDRDGAITGPISSSTR